MTITEALEQYDALIQPHVIERWEVSNIFTDLHRTLLDGLAECKSLDTTEFITLLNLITGSVEAACERARV